MEEIERRYWRERMWSHCRWLALLIVTALVSIVLFWLCIRQYAV